MHKRIAGAAFLVLMLLLPAACGDGEAERTGVIDIESVYMESGKIEDFQEELEETGVFIQEQFDLEEEELAEEEKQRRREELYEEFQYVQKRLQEDLEGEVNAVIEEVAREKGLTVVLDRRFVRYGGVDITGDVVERLVAAERDGQEQGED